MLSTRAKLTPILVTRVEENLKKTFGHFPFDYVFGQHSNVVYFRTRLHAGIIANEQMSRDLHERLSEQFIVTSKKKKS